jgi:hypothetical protein
MFKQTGIRRIPWFILGCWMWTGCSNIFAAPISNFEVALAQLKQGVQKQENAKTLVMILRSAYTQGDEQDKAKMMNVLSRISSVPAIDAKFAHVQVQLEKRKAVALQGMQEIAPWIMDMFFYHTHSMALSNPPPARAYHAQAYDSENKRLFIFGGQQRLTATGPVVDLNDTWIADLGTKEWKQIATDPASTPAARELAGAAYVPGARKIYLFGGKSQSAVYNDLWVFDLNTAAWTLQPTTNPPEKQSGAVFVYDPDFNIIILFGGSGASGARDGSVMCLDLGTMSWEYIGTDGATPTGCQTFSAAFSMKLKRLFVLCGCENCRCNESADQARLWSIEFMRFHTPTWQEAAVGSTRPPGRAYPGFVYDSIGNNRLILFGGGCMRLSPLGHFIPDARRDLWVFGLNASVWEQIENGKDIGLLSRSGITADFDNHGSRAIVFGGSAMLGGSLNDTVELSIPRRFFIP